jgi:glycogen phosphorylase
MEARRSSCSGANGEAMRRTLAAKLDDVHPGRADLDRAATALAARLPWPLAPLARVAYNYRWSWHPDGPALFRDIDRDRWRLTQNNPVRLLQEASNDALVRAAADRALVARAEAVERDLAEDLARPSRGPASDERPVAFFCAEYGFHVSMPVYSGGLGALAGDILKEASDRALAMVGVGLMYRRGYFRQRIDATGWQQESWVPTDPERTPAARVTGADGEPLRVTIPVAGQDVAAQVWRIDVGRVPLYLLDTDVPGNTTTQRWITQRLYDGDPETRLAQYAVLGLGGIRALRALGIDPSVVHMNEGHAALAAVQLELDGVDDRRERTVFTTHTPVPAGNDTYPPERLHGLLEGLPLDVGELVRRGRTNPGDEGEPFGVTQFALRTSRAANGVARRHGEVSREMWQGLWPGTPVDEVPIGHVTNGVHVPTWIAPPMRELLDRHLGPGWIDRADDPSSFEAIDAIGAHELWEVRCRQRAHLVDFVRERSTTDRLFRGDDRRQAEAAASAFDPDVLTVGFARRLATYKRLSLLLADVGRSLAVLGGERPIQLVLAGKAHPKDDEGKRLVQGLFDLRGEPVVSERVVYLEDYDLALGARLTRGCDVWLNVPRPPLEASGTSGMKNVLNGGLQLSVLDGWWAEGYDGHNGWAIDGSVDPDHAAQDARHAAELFRLLTDEVLPEFHDRDEGGVPQAWVARMKRSMRTLIPAFSAARMVRDYEEQVYAVPAVR